MGGCVDVREARLGGDEAVEAAGLTTTADDGRAARPDGKGTGCATVTAIVTVSDGRADGGTVRIPVHSHAAEVRTVSRRRGRPLRAEAAAEAADAGSIHAGGNAPPGRRAVGSSHGDRCFGVGSERGVLELKRPLGGRPPRGAFPRGWRAVDAAGGGGPSAEAGRPCGRAGPDARSEPPPLLLPPVLPSSMPPPPDRSAPFRRRPRRERPRRRCRRRRQKHRPQSWGRNRLWGSQAAHALRGKHYTGLEDRVPACISSTKRTRGRGGSRLPVTKRPTEWKRRTAGLPCLTVSHLAGMPGWDAVQLRCTAQFGTDARLAGEDRPDAAQDLFGVAVQHVPRRPCREGAIARRPLISPGDNESKNGRRSVSACFHNLNAVDVRQRKVDHGQIGRGRAQDVEGLLSGSRHPSDLDARLESHDPLVAFADEFVVFDDEQPGRRRGRRCVGRIGHRSGRQGEEVQGKESGHPGGAFGRGAAAGPSRGFASRDQASRDRASTDRLGWIRPRRTNAGIHRTSGQPVPAVGRGGRVTRAALERSSRFRPAGCWNRAVRGG